jgi:hypothetical protein
MMQLRQNHRMLDYKEEVRINRMNHNFLHDYPSFILTAPLILFMLTRL